MSLKCLIINVAPPTWPSDHGIHVAIVFCVPHRTTIRTATSACPSHPSETPQPSCDTPMPPPPQPHRNSSLLHVHCQSLSYPSHVATCGVHTSIPRAPTDMRLC
ncbi:hypothetical protein EUGRSUZ_B03479 [Eucalyptus grandis]|uniref:Uncharacterized protein n=2 Tax=Eucalyptus grandis TaxID=71139 RepID=A0ACC3LXU4_EUCGR|nr:hypothetical protein EUGRSUZ_B03479 [Eucalyptus grandis]